MSVGPTFRTWSIIHCEAWPETTMRPPVSLETERTAPVIYFPCSADFHIFPEPGFPTFRFLLQLHFHVTFIEAAA